jgi:CelD/BcsL family acetyltransferase involved in cellulose biosynthesis
MALDLTAREARDLGDPEVRDYAGPVAAPGREAEVAGLAMDWLAEDFMSRAVSWGLPAGGPMTVALAAAADERGWRVTEEDEAVCPALDLPGSWEEYVASLPKHDRHELRRKLRHLEAAGTVTFEEAASPGDVAAGFDTFLDLMRASRPDKDGFLTPAMESFFRDLAATFAGLGMASLGSLLLDGRTVAMTFAFEQEGATYLYNSGYDPAQSHLAVGLLSKALAIRCAIERGQRRFDFLRGDEEYKRRLGGVPARVVRLRMER